MNLVVEIGNSTIKLGEFEGEKMTNMLRSDDEHFIISELKKKKYDRAIMAGSGNLNSAVWSEIQADMKKNFQRDYCQNVQIQYATPETLGQDRLVNSSYASYLFPNQNNLIIDAGTCITFTFVNSQNQIIGGSISPGIKMRAYSLNQFTDKLPYIEYDQTTSANLIGMNTVESILSGVIYGAVAEIEYRIQNFQSIYENLNIIMTGGDTQILQNKIKYQIFADSEFTIKGLNQILINI